MGFTGEGFDVHSGSDEMKSLGVFVGSDVFLHNLAHTTFFEFEVRKNKHYGAKESSFCSILFTSSHPSILMDPSYLILFFASFRSIGALGQLDLETFSRQTSSQSAAWKPLKGLDNVKLTIDATSDHSVTWT